MTIYKVVAGRFHARGTEVEVQDMQSAENLITALKREPDVIEMTIYGVYHRGHNLGMVTFMGITVPKDPEDLIALKHWRRDKSTGRWKEIKMAGGFTFRPEDINSLWQGP